MRQRIAELETTVNQIVERLNDLNLDVDEILKDIDLEAGSAVIVERDREKQSLNYTKFSKLSVSDDLETEVEKTPYFCFFDNNILGIEKAVFDATDSTISPDRRSSFVSDKYHILIQRLETIAPSRQLVHAIVQESCLTLGILRSSFAELQCMFSGSTDDPGWQFLRSWIIESFHSNDPARVCKVLILLAACIQQLPPGQQIGRLRLRTPLAVLQKQYMDAADAFLAPDDGILGTVGGLECLLSQVTFYLHAGLPRKAWVLFRRAATFAQLLSPSSTCSDTRLLRIWMQLWQIDKSLSLLLGLPYMLMPSNVPLNASSLPPQALFAFELGKIGARVIDRNLAGWQSMVFKDTIELDEDLNECMSLMAPQFWSPPSAPGIPVEAMFATNTIHFWCHSLRNLIHMPFALNRDEHAQREFSEQSSFGSSKEMLRIYKILRDPERPILRQCDMLDFQAMTAALMVIHLLLENSMTLDTQQAEQDWQTIYDVVDLMKAVGQDMPDSVAAQAALLLHDVAGLRDSSVDREGFHVSLPYFGRLYVRHRYVAHMPPKQDNEMASYATPDAAANYLTFDDFSFHDSMEWLGDQDWTSTINFSLLDNWQWSGDEFGDL
jgi:hypothetical protein